MPGGTPPTTRSRSIFFLFKLRKPQQTYVQQNLPRPYRGEGTSFDLGALSLRLSVYSLETASTHHILHPRN